ncbi:MAG: hypothetical protein HC894_26475, partial [Microcoleus sp. SM1_3_4]|nr:hypothetical protein [Microcoleus sp. SM1_3_4]
VDAIAPLQNRALANRMMLDGAVYAEVLPETPPPPNLPTLAQPPGS